MTDEVAFVLMVVVPLAFAIFIIVKVMRYLKRKADEATETLNADKTKKPTTSQAASSKAKTQKPARKPAQELSPVEELAYLRQQLHQHKITPELYEKRTRELGEEMARRRAQREAAERQAKSPEK